MVVGAVENVPLFEDPQVPLIASIVLFALQFAVDPPLLPEQDQYQGPEPLTKLAVPELHRLIVGAELNVPLFDDPHCPLIGSADL